LSKQRLGEDKDVKYSKNDLIQYYRYAAESGDVNARVKKTFYLSSNFFRRKS